MGDTWTVQPCIHLLISCIFPACRQDLCTADFWKTLKRLWSHRTFLCGSQHGGAGCVVLHRPAGRQGCSAGRTDRSPQTTSLTQSAPIIWSKRSSTGTIVDRASHLQIACAAIVISLLALQYCTLWLRSARFSSALHTCRPCRDLSGVDAWTPPPRSS